MTSTPFEGLSILLVEDEPLIAFDIAQCFAKAGANMIVANTLTEAVRLVEQDGLAGAVLDHALSDGNCAKIYGRLRQRGIPFLVYSGLATSDDLPKDVPFLDKPVAEHVLVTTLQRLIKSSPASDP